MVQAQTKKVVGAVAEGSVISRNLWRCVTSGPCISSDRVEDTVRAVTGKDHGFHILVLASAVLEITFLQSWLHFLCHSFRARGNVSERPRDCPQPRRTSRIESPIHQAARRTSRSDDPAGSPRSFANRDRSADRLLTPTVTCWCQRFQTLRLDGLLGGHKTPLPTDIKSRVLEQVTQPRIDEPLWSYRSMPRVAGISATSAHRL